MLGLAASYTRPVTLFHEGIKKDFGKGDRESRESLSHGHQSDSYPYSLYLELSFLPPNNGMLADSSHQSGSKCNTTSSSYQVRLSVILPAPSSLYLARRDLRAPHPHPRVLFTEIFLGCFKGGETEASNIYSPQSMLTLRLLSSLSQATVRGIRVA